MTGWSGSQRNKKDPSRWKSTRRRIFARDGGRCYVCGNPGAVEVDHVIPLAQGGSSNDDNLAAICKPCHKTKTQREAAAARARRPSSRRPTDTRPGIP